MNINKYPTEIWCPLKTCPENETPQHPTIRCAVWQNEKQRCDDCPLATRQELHGRE